MSSTLLSHSRLATPTVSSQSVFLVFLFFPSIYQNVQHVCATLRMRNAKITINYNLDTVQSAVGSPFLLFKSADKLVKNTNFENWQDFSISFSIFLEYIPHTHTRTHTHTRLCHWVRKSHYEASEGSKQVAWVAVVGSKDAQRGRRGRGRGGCLPLLSSFSFRTLFA